MLPRVTHAQGNAGHAEEVAFNAPHVNQLRLDLAVRALIASFKGMKSSPTRPQARMARGTNSAPSRPRRLLTLPRHAGFCTASALPMRAAAASRKLCNRGD